MGRVHETVWVGEVSGPLLVPIGQVTCHVRGAYLHGLALVLGSRLPGDGNDHWTLRVGRMRGREGFEALYEQRLGYTGTAGGLTSIDFPTPLRYATNEIAALTLSPFGAPPIIEGLGLIPDFEVFGTQET